MVDKTKGITIQEFRNQNEQYVLSKACNHINPSIDQSVYMQVVPTGNDELDNSTYTV
jgi:hypothetical protein